jgi:hypothetical protein
VIFSRAITATDERSSRANPWQHFGKETPQIGVEFALQFMSLLFIATVLTLNFQGFIVGAYSTGQIQHMEDEYHDIPGVL